MAWFIDLLGWRFDPVNTDWETRPGIYLVVRWDNGRYRPLYVGQTNCLSARFRNHERLEDAHDMGANAVFFLECRDWQARLDVETLIRRFRFLPVNQQARPSRAEALRAATRLGCDDIRKQLISEIVQQIVSRLRRHQYRHGNAFANY